MVEYTLQVCNLSAKRVSPGGYGARQAGLWYGLALLAEEADGAPPPIDYTRSRSKLVGSRSRSYLIIQPSPARPARSAILFP